MASVSKLKEPCRPARWQGINNDQAAAVALAGRHGVREFCVIFTTFSPRKNLTNVKKKQKAEESRVIVSARP